MRFWLRCADGPTMRALDLALLVELYNRSLHYGESTARKRPLKDDRVIDHAHDLAASGEVDDRWFDWTPDDIDLYPGELVAVLIEVGLVGWSGFSFFAEPDEATTAATLLAASDRRYLDELGVVSR